MGRMKWLCKEEGRGGGGCGEEVMGRGCTVVGRCGRRGDGAGWEAAETVSS
jgi:hypothetical protein